MILTGAEIKKQVYEGNISISPFNENMLNPNSYNYLLGDTYIEPNSDLLLKIPPEGIMLKPKRLYLFSTLEKIGSKRFVTLLIGRSSLGRLGVFLNPHADLGHTGTDHCWTLEIMCVQPVKLYARMRIGQVSFWITTGTLIEYSGHYHNINDPHKSLYTPNELRI